MNHFLSVLPHWCRKWHDPAWVQELLAVVLLVSSIACCKLLVLFLDPHVRLFMGDSASYLSYAVAHGTPPDRSFTYPELINQTAGRTGSIVSLLLVQTGLGIAAAMVLFSILYRACGVRFWLAALAAVVLALDPSQLFYERMVMTETAAGFCLLACLWVELRYLRTAHPLWLVVAAICGVVLVSLRIGMLPLALCLAPVGPLMLFLLRGRRHVPYLEWPRFCAHLGLALIATWSSHHAYKAWYGARVGATPMYLQQDGIFRLGLVVPLLKPEYFAGTGLKADILNEVGLPLDDPRKREAHIWRPGGLIAVLRAHAGEHANDVAEMLAERAIRQDPWGLVRMGMATFCDYFYVVLREDRLRSDLGFGELPDDRTLQLLREKFHYDLGQLPRTPTPVSRYFEHGALWLIVVLFALLPLAFVTVVSNWRVRPASALLIAMVAAGLVLGELLCSHIISFRYLHPFPPLFVACAALLADSRVHSASRACVPDHRMSHPQDVGDGRNFHPGAVVAGHIAAA